MSVLGAIKFSYVVKVYVFAEFIRNLAILLRPYELALNPYDAVDVDISISIITKYNYVGPYRVEVSLQTFLHKEGRPGYECRDEKLSTKLNVKNLLVPTVYYVVFGKIKILRSDCKTKMYK